MMSAPTATQKAKSLTNLHLDEHAKDRKDRKYERHYHRNVHSTHPPALRRDAKNRAGVKGESASRGPSHPKKRSKARTATKQPALRYRHETDMPSRTAHIR
jgi:hypothetical protein